MKRIAALLLGAVLALPCVIARPAWATVTDTSGGRLIATGNGSTTGFVFLFPARSKTDVIATVVLSNGTTSPLTYNTVLNADQINSPGGTLTFTTAPPASSTITIQRKQSFTQLTSMPTYPPPKTVERAMDAIMMGVQQVDRDRADLAAKEAADISSTIAGGIGATNLMQFTATGGTVPLTMPQWMSYLPNVISYGADKTGGIDSTAAFNAAWAQGNCVFVPAGTFKVNLLIQTSNTCIIGMGETSILKAASSASPVVKLLSSVVGGQILGARIQDVKILGLGTGEGLHLEAATPYVITESYFGRIKFDQLTNALLISVPNAEVYLNKFEQLTSINTAGTAYTILGAYNHFSAISATNTTTKAWDDGGSATYVHGLTTDGIIRGWGQNGDYTGVTIEIINGTPGAAQGALQFVGYGYRLKGLTLTNVDNAKVNYGISFDNGPHWLTGFRMWGTLCPQYPISFGAGSVGGTIDGIKIDTSCTPSNFRFEQYTSDTILQSWGFRNIDPRASTRDYSTGVVSGDRGDVSVTLTVGVDVPIQRWATALTANRTITLSTTGALNGSKFRIVRTGLGAFTLAVGALKTIPSATAAFVDVVFDGTAWQLAAYGTL